MSRKDYIAIAKLMSTTPISDAYRARIAHGLADIFAADNRAFDRERFLAACAEEAKP